MRSFRVYVVIASLLLLVTALLFCTNLHPRPSIDVLSNVIPQPNGQFSGGHLELRLNKLYDGVETLVLFIGHARSGHSLIGAILDAHPEIIIPHEYNLIVKWSEFKLKSGSGLKTRVLFALHALSRFQAMFGNRAASRRSGGGYSYSVPGQWQGTYKERVKVIGDKKGTATSHLLENPKNFDILEDISRTLTLKLKFIHVIRNPFDNIATKLLRNLEVRDMAKSSTFKASNVTLLDKIIDDFFAKVKSAERLKRYGKFEVLDVYGHEVISKPRESLQNLCNFLKVACYPDFVESASELLYAKPSLTRHAVAWTSKQKERIMNEMNKYSFLERFSFDSDSK